MNPQEMQAGEQAEDQALEQIMQICQQSKDASGYQQIAEIVQGLLGHNQEEQGQIEEKPSFQEKLGNAMRGGQEE